MFDTLIGNDLVKKILKKAFDADHLSNTLLFSGPDGIGKSLFAKELALHLMYPDAAYPDPVHLEKKHTDPIDQKTLPAVSQSSSLQPLNSKSLDREGADQKSDHSQENDLSNVRPYPDLHQFYPEGKTGMHSIASMRELISQVFMAPYESESKVFIIHDAERMLPSSSNALLKTLEEPTLDSYIILLSSKPEDLLSTIVSRCSKITFQSILEKEIQTYLVDKVNIPSHEAAYIASFSYGSLAKALELAHHQARDLKQKLLLDILEGKEIQGYHDLSIKLTQLEELCSSDEEIEEEDPKKKESLLFLRWRKEVDILLSQVFMWYRDLHLLKAKADRRYLFFQDRQTGLLAQDFEKIPTLQKLQELIEEVKIGVDRNIKLKTCLEQLFFKLKLV